MNGLSIESLQTMDDARAYLINILKDAGDVHRLQGGFQNIMVRVNRGELDAGLIPAITEYYSEARKKLLEDLTNKFFLELAKAPTATVALTLIESARWHFQDGQLNQEQIEVLETAYEEKLRQLSLDQS